MFMIHFMHISLSCDLQKPRYNIGELKKHAKYRHTVSLRRKCFQICGAVGSLTM